MKTIKSLLFLSILVSLDLFVFSGCYTLLVVTDDDTDIIVFTPQPPIIEPIPPWPDCCSPTLPPPPPQPIFIPLPLATSSPTVTNPASQPIRDSGYQRSGVVENNQSVDSPSRIRSGGNQRGGR